MCQSRPPPARRHQKRPGNKVAGLKGTYLNESKLLWGLCFPRSNGCVQKGIPVDLSALGRGCKEVGKVSNRELHYGIMHICTYLHPYLSYGSVHFLLMSKGVSAHVLRHMTECTSVYID